MTPEEHLSAFERACQDKIMRLMPIKLRDNMTGDVSTVRPIQQVEVQTMGDAYRVRATFFDGSRLSHAQTQMAAHASPIGAAASAVHCLMRAKQIQMADG